MIGDLYSSALHFIVHRHAGQKDKAGKPYIQHLLRVSLLGKIELEQVVGLLHDVLEDTSTTYSELLAEFGMEAADAILLLTRSTEALSTGYYASIRSNPLALAVKLNDIEDSTQPERLLLLPVEERVRLRGKYHNAIRMLVNPPSESE